MGYNYLETLRGTSADTLRQTVNGVLRAEHTGEVVTFRKKTLLFKCFWLNIMSTINLFVVRRDAMQLNMHELDNIL